MNGHDGSPPVSRPPLEVMASDTDNRTQPPVQATPMSGWFTPVGTYDGPMMSPSMGGDMAGYPRRANSVERVRLPPSARTSDATALSLHATSLNLVRGRPGLGARPLETHTPGGYSAPGGSTVGAAHSPINLSERIASQFTAPVPRPTPPTSVWNHHASVPASSVDFGHVLVVPPSMSNTHVASRELRVDPWVAAPAVPATPSRPKTSDVLGRSQSRVGSRSPSQNRSEQSPQNPKDPGLLTLEELESTDASLISQGPVFGGSREGIGLGVSGTETSVQLNSSRKRHSPRAPTTTATRTAQSQLQPSSVLDRMLERFGGGASAFSSQLATHSVAQPVAVSIPSPALPLQPGQLSVLNVPDVIRLNQHELVSVTPRRASTTTSYEARFYRPAVDSNIPVTQPPTPKYEPRGEVQTDSIIRAELLHRPGADINVSHEPSPDPTLFQIADRFRLARLWQRFKEGIAQQTIQRQVSEIDLWSKTLLDKVDTRWNSFRSKCIEARQVLEAGEVAIPCVSDSDPDGTANHIEQNFLPQAARGLDANTSRFLPTDEDSRQVTSSTNSPRVMASETPSRPEVDEALNRLAEAIRRAELAEEQHQKRMNPSSSRRGSGSNSSSSSASQPSTNRARR